MVEGETVNAAAAAAGSGWSTNDVYYLTLAAALVGIVVYKFVFSTGKLPPGPKPLPVVGNLYDVKPVRFQCFMEWAKKFGPILSFRMGTTLNVVVTSPDLAKEVLKEKDQLLAARPLTRAAARFSRNGQDLIWADYGPHYVKVRKLCTLELFTPKRLEALRSVRQEEMGYTINAIFKESKDCPGASVSVKKHLSAVAFNNITRIVFGKRFVDANGVVDSQGVEFKEIIAEGMKLGASLKMSEHISYIRWMFPLQEEAFARNGARRDTLTKAIMQEFATSREQHEDGSNQHFVNALLNFQKQYDLSETTVITLLWDMITAGMDTTAITVEWAMAELIRNPDVQKKAQDELDSVVGYERVLTELDFPHLPYLQALAKEALRLHPPTPLLLPHKASQNVKLGGYDVPKGATVHVNAYAIARDPTIWEDPLRFKPDRFLEEDIDMKGTDFRLIPFGAGRRVCPGAQLGINIVQLMLGRMLHHFTWSPPEGMTPEEIDLTPRPGVVTFMAKPLQATVSPRLPSSLYV
ncbi:unnamed protein product [Calypogeia fissa]